MSQSSTARVTVRYAETDQMGVAYYANYFVWMEVGRVELFKSMGIRYRDLEREGFLLTVVEANCRYHQPARYDDELLVETTVLRATSRLLEICYLLRRSADGAILARGHTKHLVCDRNLGPAKLPLHYRNTFASAVAPPASPCI